QAGEPESTPQTLGNVPAEMLALRFWTCLAVSSNAAYTCLGTRRERRFQAMARDRGVNKNQGVWSLAILLLCVGATPVVALGARASAAPVGATPLVVRSA